MYCPKCGAQNADKSKFCRGCGADVGKVLAVIEGRPASATSSDERQIELFSAGLRGLIVGICMIIGAGVGLAISLRLAVVAIFVFAFASYFVGSGISRLVHARALKRLRESSTAPPVSLPPADPDYIQAQQSIFQTDDLIATPRSVTENTTRHLKDPKDGV